MRLATPVAKIEVFTSRHVCIAEDAKGITTLCVEVVI